jgi:Ala-tRNA(Pro) deacylase
MAIAMTLRQYFADNGIEYQTVPHPRTLSASETAEAAHVSGSRVAKAVLLKEGKDEFLLAVLPASHHIRLDRLRSRFNDRLDLATEEEVEALFADCDLGAVPPIGKAYGLDVILDDSLDTDGDVYFEGGDHTTLVRVDAAAFDKLMGNVRQERFADRG